MDEKQALQEVSLSSEEVYSGKLLHVFKDDIVLPSGRHSKREYIKHLGAVAVVPLTEDGYVIAERQFRYPFSRVLTEIPAGKLDSEEEIPLEAAKRELLEETGYVASFWTNLGPLYPTVAYSTEVIHLFLAKELSFQGQALDEGEFLSVIKIPLREFVAMVMNGEVEDAKTQAAILKAARMEGV